MLTPPSPAVSHSPVQCAECASRLAHDQRYCVECGARRGPLPAGIAPLIGAIHEQGQAAALPAAEPLAGSLDKIGTRPPRFEFALPGPRAAAVAVMGMLAFGVTVGSLVGGTSVVTLASAPLIIAGLTHPAAGTPAGQNAAQNAGQNVTVTDVVGGGTASAPTAAASATAAAQAPAQASTSPSTSPVSSNTTGSSTPSASGLPPVKHVFMIVLSDRGFNQSFGGNSGYLSGALRRQGELVQNYYAVAGAPLANEIALISGQGPTAQTAADCPVFSPIRPAGKGGRGQVLGTGCDYPRSTKTLPGQLAAAGDSWTAYVAGVSDSARTACRVPKPGSKQPQTAGAHTSYESWRNPFLYFRSLTAGTACRDNEVGLGQLAKDVKTTKTAPSLAYVIPAACADGSESPCKPGASTGLDATNQFLKSVVPEIKSSPAYKDGGLIAITFDQAPQTGTYADPSACCNSPSYPNLSRLAPGTPAVPPGAMGPGASTNTTTGTTTNTFTGPNTTSTTGTDTTSTTSTTGTDTTSTTGTDTTSTTGTDTTGTGTAGTGTTTTPTPPLSLGLGQTTPTGGGGQVGLLLISQYVKRNSIDVVDYFNHFSLLATIQEMFGLHRLGYAGVLGLPLFGNAVFNNYAG